MLVLGFTLSFASAVCHRFVGPCCHQFLFSYGFIFETMAYSCNLRCPVVRNYAAQSGFCCTSSTLRLLTESSFANIVQLNFVGGFARQCRRCRARSSSELRQKHSPHVRECFCQRAVSRAPLHCREKVPTSLAVTRSRHASREALRG